MNSPASRLRIEVEWASIVQATGDVYVVGHYIGVLPQNAELVLDYSLSGLTPPTSATPKKLDERLILTDLTRRGAIRGSLGDIVFFPWKDKGQLVLAGMGRLGTFKQAQLVILAASLAQTIGRLLPNPTVCTVLIGAGYGNLKIDEAVAGLLDGIVRTLAADKNLSFTLRIIEYRLDRAYEILKVVTKVAQRMDDEKKIGITVAEDVTCHAGRGGSIPTRFCFSLILASLAQATQRKDNPLTPSLDALINGLPADKQDDVRKELMKLGVEANSRRLGLCFLMAEDDGPKDSSIADRISFSYDGTGVQSAAITNLTTVTTKSLEMGQRGIDRVVDTLRDEQMPAEYPRTAFLSLVHPELVEKMLLPDALVLELDRTMARVPWELLSDDVEQPLAILRPIARQLRTSYSPRTSDLLVVQSTAKALVIGDPDGTLPRAVDEARAVQKVLEDHGLRTDVRIGLANEFGLPAKPNPNAPHVEPVNLYEILELLRTGDYLIVHFAGHAFFNPQYPDRSGWYFRQGEVLTAAKIEGVQRVPRLVVANACVSAELSPVQTGKCDDSTLVASLADEFFRRGVADYIGTAWQVNDAPAKQFAETFYTKLLEGWRSTRQSNQQAAISLGAAIQTARAELFRQRKQGERDWAAYQHYGDPTRTLDDYRA